MLGDDEELAGVAGDVRTWIGTSDASTFSVRCIRASGAESITVTSESVARPSE